MRSIHPTLPEFTELVRSGAARAGGGSVVVPMSVALLDDQLTPVLAYRRLVAPDARTAPSFLLESVEGGERQGRYSIVSAQPVIEVVARGDEVRIEDLRTGANGAGGTGGAGGAGGGVRVIREANPLEVPRRLTEGLTLVGKDRADLPACFLGGWVGYASYDTVRYAEPEKLPLSAAPRDDRGLPELDFAYYDSVVVFDHVRKLVHVVKLVEVRLGEEGAGKAGGKHTGEVGSLSDESIRAAYLAGAQFLGTRVEELQRDSRHLVSGRMDLSASAGNAKGTEGAGTAGGGGTLRSNLTRDEHAAMVARAQGYIAAGDIFQVVLGQRFERVSRADPFDVYRALRAVNPSPYMAYVQARGCILVASSPEILCRVRREKSGARIITNRPLAGTRRRGKTQEEDAALERELLADPKERAEHIMLVDLGRNDVGQVAKAGTVSLPSVMSIERYSHVMHISSTVTGELREGLTCWDALRATLPVGTISGAPKIRAMQIIDELEPIRRGPYGGGLGYVSLDGDMDIALALRTMVVPIALYRPDAATTGGKESGGSGGEWTYHLQSAGGIVADSKAEDEYQETVNKAAGLARAIDVAESAFGVGGHAARE